MIFLLHWTRDDVTNNCLMHLQGQGPVIVIDNGSPVPFVPASPVAVLRWSDNLFFVEAFNRAMKLYPSTDYVCCTNDTEPASDMVSKLLTALDDPTVGVVAPGTNDTGAGILYVDRPGDYPSWQTSHVDSTCCAFRHDLVQKIGYPDCEGHTHRQCWASNQDFCYRARLAGYKVLAVRGAYIRHAHMGGQDREAWWAGREWLIRKWGTEAEKVWR